MSKRACNYRESSHSDAYSYELGAIFIGAQSRRGGAGRDFDRLWDAVGPDIRRGQLMSQIATVTGFPGRWRSEETVWIPMRDGARLRRAGSGCPRDAEGDPVPAVLEYIPYRRVAISPDRATP